MKILKATREQLVQVTYSGWLQEEGLFIQKCLHPKAPKRASSFGSTSLPRIKCKNHPFSLYLYNSDIERLVSCIILGCPPSLVFEVTLLTSKPASGDNKGFKLFSTLEPWMISFSRHLERLPCGSPLGSSFYAFFTNYYDFSWLILSLKVLLSEAHFVCWSMISLSTNLPFACEWILQRYLLCCAVLS